MMKLVVTAFAFGALASSFAHARGRSHGSGPIGAYCIPSFGAATLQGMRCTDVKGGSLLHKAGVKSGDVVLSIDGKPVLSPRDMMFSIQQLRKADHAEIKILRDGKEESLGYNK